MQIGGARSEGIFFSLSLSRVRAEMTSKIPDTVYRQSKQGDLTWFEFCAQKATTSCVRRTIIGQLAFLGLLQKDI